MYKFDLKYSNNNFPAYVVPGPPKGIKAAALTGESILVSWLFPRNPNGRIRLYTIYCREAGRVGSHASYNLRMDDFAHDHGLTYEIRSLREYQLYEFWVRKIIRHEIEHTFCSILS